MSLSWQYIAGFTDGEGCIRINSNHRYGCSPKIAIAQSGARGLDVLTKIRLWLLEQDIPSNFDIQEPTKLSKLTLYRLTITKRETATKFLEGVLPYLIVKKVEAEDLLRHLKIFPALPKGGKLTWESRRANFKENKECLQ